jgi:hypothetical protein
VLAVHSQFLTVNFMRSIMQQRRRFFAAMLCVAVFSSASSQALTADWPHLRGPN